MTATWFDSGAGCRPGPRMSRADKKTCVHAIRGAEEGARVQCMPGKTYAATEEGPCAQGMPGKRYASTEEGPRSGHARQDVCKQHTDVQPSVELISNMQTSAAVTVSKL